MIEDAAIGEDDIGYASPVAVWPKTAGRSTVLHHLGPRLLSLPEPCQASGCGPVLDGQERRDGGEGDGHEGDEQPHRESFRSRTVRHSVHV